MDLFSIIQTIVIILVVFMIVGFILCIAFLYLAAIVLDKVVNWQVSRAYKDRIR